MQLAINIAVLANRPGGSSGMPGVRQTTLLKRVTRYAMRLAVNSTDRDTNRTQSPS